MLDQPSPSMVPIRILLVEDNETIATMYQIKFEKAGHTVKICSNGMNAVTDVTTFVPDVILLDIMMPYMDGFETLRTIRQLAPSLRTKIIMFSNLNSPNDIEKCRALGADDYLVKADTTPKQALDAIERIFLGRPKEGSVHADHPTDISPSTPATCPHCGKHISVQVHILAE